MSCCTSHNDNNKDKKKVLSNTNKAPKSFIGKYLYNLGKYGLEKGKHRDKQKSGCC